MWGKNPLAERSTAARRAFWLDADAPQEAASLVLQNFGADVLRILLARFRDDEHVSEVFVRFTEALWLALPDFAFRCSVRAWVFTLARRIDRRLEFREIAVVLLGDEHAGEDAVSREAARLRKRVQLIHERLRRSLQK